jgi:hypothetical protein
LPTVRPPWPMLQAARVSSRSLLADVAVPKQTTLPATAIVLKPDLRVAVTAFLLPQVPARECLSLVVATPPEPPLQRALAARRGAVPQGSLRHRSRRHPRPVLREGHGAERLPQGGGRRPRVLDRRTRRRRVASLAISVPGPDSTSIGTPARPPAVDQPGRAGRGGAPGFGGVRV